MKRAISKGVDGIFWLLIGAGAALLTWGLSESGLLDPVPFEVHAMSVAEDGTVHIDSTINAELVGSFVVEIDSETQKGLCIGDGRAIYQQRPRKQVSFPLNIWVNDPGCQGRLSDGETHFMNIVWEHRHPGESQIFTTRHSVSFVYQMG